MVALIGIQLAWVLLVIFWIYWFVGRHKEIRELTELYRPGLGGGNWTGPYLLRGWFSSWSCWPACMSFSSTGNDRPISSSNKKT